MNSWGLSLLGIKGAFKDWDTTHFEIIAKSALGSDAVGLYLIIFPVLNYKR